MPNERRQRRRDDATDVLERPDTALRAPPMFKVLLHNDDYTPMDFVVSLLMRLFGKPQDEAVAIMLNVHRLGVGVAGVYPFAIAETKVARARALAEENEHPLRCSLEPE